MLHNIHYWYDNLHGQGRVLSQDLISSIKTSCTYGELFVKSYKSCFNGFIRIGYVQSQRQVSHVFSHSAIKFPKCSDDR